MHYLNTLSNYIISHENDKFISFTESNNKYTLSDYLLFLAVCISSNNKTLFLYIFNFANKSFDLKDAAIINIYSSIFKNAELDFVNFIFSNSNFFDHLYEGSVAGIMKHCENHIILFFADNFKELFTNDNFYFQIVTEDYDRLELIIKQQKIKTF